MSKNNEASLYKYNQAIETRW